MNKWLLLPCLLVVIIGGCAQKPLPPVAISIPSHKVDYLQEVKPILDKRCVVCHSCYNSPCQLKLSSFEGADRGASKKAIYDSSRLQTMDPSRLFIDAQTTEQWREKEFFSVTQNRAADGFSDSLMLQLLNHKMEHPKSTGSYFSEANDLTCSKDSAELGSYLQKHPNRGMPFGFPPLKKEEYSIIAGWIVQGAHGPSVAEQRILTAIDGLDKQLVEQWETFLNNPKLKYVVTARYLYEHLFLAHITFKTGSDAFYELVRSRTPFGRPVDVIPTVRPYDDPGTAPFYYRFRRIHSTIVHKTHMVFPLDGEQYTRINALFIEPKWLQEPHAVSFDPVVSANPFAAFEQIPPRSRYQFLLDNANYIIMTFIRGPVCKGQVALNVINDHFWVMFLDPDHDLTVRHPGFLKLHSSDLTMPSEEGSGYRLFNALGNRYSQGAVRFYKARQDFYASYLYQGQGMDSIWKGNRPADTPLLTVFRHFDSASVHKGVLGGLPHTAWVMDFPLLERIYYSLVAGFDVYGTVGHQLATRLYMDRLRIEGESYFLDFLPQADREELMRQWYHGVSFDEVNYYPAGMGTTVEYTTSDPQREFIERLVSKHVLPETGIDFDNNYLKAGETYPALPQNYTTTEDYLRGFHAVSAPGTAFFRFVQDQNVNVAHMRIRIPDREDAVVSIVIHRWHDNVTFLFSEKRTLNPEKDQADFISGFVGSYPNNYIDLSVEELPAFLSLLAHFDGSVEDIQKMEKFSVNRADDNFWEVHDWFQERFSRDNPETAGLFDLNRYYYEAR
ncbi:fatty acid cis/trans isomerase [Desulfogranum marinum]|uniref:fatty acid cis/trans isomerase n=1 Tax=Desulfogranum marinum TaxID=453220 RepID=UPI001962F3C5|nr:fatty acid cis/trans isomerase [Desulfogranum marinum]MBM9513220.1 fatty acid cis/trans isomerase [Desulfogranum marinum]